MSSILFLLQNKERRKIFFLCIGIGLPMLLLTAVGINYYESSSEAEGTPNDKGGISYYYRESSDAEKLPEPVTKLISKYPNSKVTYINVSTDKAGTIGGDFISFTKDDFKKVKDYYGKTGKVVDQDGDRLEIENAGVKISITKENIYEDDPIKDQTKFKIYIID
ncbi:hypothetical protein EZJ43_07910 [Pedobacter changchengzhani]|uniref:Uncharacterized protein n=1 Tax=Pedobacter changchengzhani TaxID=2529274 RepID=A0A4R5MMD0_9SPHI|nr:hypothetical protein [Pedobacter changchengzhani]TDG36435.1 hypothetical protein EZJ43_07910 [Pedobacter changchengzhani]